jgi:hypothetical protein
MLINNALVYSVSLHCDLHKTIKHRLGRSVSAKPSLERRKCDRVTLFVRLIARRMSPDPGDSGGTFRADLERFNALPSAELTPDRGCVSTRRKVKRR